MANTFLRELADYINTNTAFVLGTDLFCGVQPDSPDRCVSLHEVPISLNWSRMHTWQVQLLARDFDFWHAHEDCFTLFDLFVNQGFMLVSYQVFISNSEMPPTYAGRDEAGRVLVSTRLSMPFKEV